MLGRGLAGSVELAAGVGLGLGQQPVADLPGVGAGLQDPLGLVLGVPEPPPVLLQQLLGLTLCSACSSLPSMLSRRSLKASSTDGQTVRYMMNTRIRKAIVPQISSFAAGRMGFCSCSAAS